MTVNCSDNLNIPYSEDFFKYTTTAENVLIALSGVLTLVTLALYIKNVLYLRANHKTSNAILLRSCVILGVYPIMAILYFFSICEPRSYLLCQLLVTVYVSVSMFLFYNLIILYFGGKRLLESKLKNEVVRLRTFPFCCCCVAPFPVTRKVINTILLFVGQNAVIQIVVSFLSLVLWLDGKYGVKVGFTDSSLYLSMVTVVSTMIGIGGIKLMVMTSKSVDESLQLAKKSMVLILALLCHNVQRFVFTMLGRSGIPDCNEGLTSSVRGRAWNGMIVILEIFLLSSLAMKVYRTPINEQKAPGDGGLDNDNHSINDPTDSLEDKGKSLDGAELREGDLEAGQKQIKSTES